MAQGQGGGGFILLVAVGVGLWFWQGNPPKDLATWFYKDTAAPWEKVDAFYYPDRNNLTAWEASRDLPSLDACRAWVRSSAAQRNDPSLLRGDYECAVGEPYDYAGISVYRATLR